MCAFVTLNKKITYLLIAVSELVTQKLERKQQKLNDHTERLQRLRSSLNELRSERLQIETDLQRRTRLEETKDELTSSNETLDCEILVSSLFSDVCEWLSCFSHIMLLTLRSVEVFLCCSSVFVKY